MRWKKDHEVKDEVKDEETDAWSPACFFVDAGGYTYMFLS
jgi:hypothetical protein